MLSITTIDRKMCLDRLIGIYLSSHIHTLILFTWTDYKTIFLPVTLFAIATSPACSPSGILRAGIWTWVHLILCNVSNQAFARKEDSINHPWRPLPSGRVTELQAMTLRWLMIPLCVIMSASYGLILIPVTLALAAVTILYDEGGLSSHPLGKNLCGVGGYGAFELGAVTIMGGLNYPDSISESAIVINALIIMTTIQAQDFPDIQGDIISKRNTFPIYAPELSRLFTLLIIPFWSVALGYYWKVGIFIRAIYFGLGCVVGLRYYWRRTQDDDKYTYILFNIWLTVCHIMPFHARSGILSF